MVDIDIFLQSLRGRWRECFPCHGPNSSWPPTTNNKQTLPDQKLIVPVPYTCYPPSTPVTHHPHLSPTIHTCHSPSTPVTHHPHLSPTIHTCHPPSTPVTHHPHLSPILHTCHPSSTPITHPPHLSPFLHTCHPSSTPVILFPPVTPPSTPVTPPPVTPLHTCPYPSTPVPTPPHLSLWLYIPVGFITAKVHFIGDCIFSTTVENMGRILEQGKLKYHHHIT